MLCWCRSTATIGIEETRLKMSESSRSPPRDRKMRTERVSYRDAPYRRDFRRGSRFLIAQSFSFMLHAYYSGTYCSIVTDKLIIIMDKELFVLCKRTASFQFRT